MTFAPFIGECPVCHRSSEEFLIRPAGEADRIAALEAQLADWERRSESCESKLGQLEANEQVIELEAKVRELEAMNANQKAMIEGRHQYVGQDFQFKLHRKESELTASRQQVERLVEALKRAERKLSAYVGVCTGDKELTNTVLPLAREALAAVEKERKG